jgi:TolA-binding protein
MKEKMMKKLTMLLLLGLALGSQALYAASDSTQSFWDMLRSKLESLTPQKKVTATNATGGVRGSAVAAEDVYWKNEATGQTIDSDELDAFKKAVKLVDIGNKGQAKTAFSDFIKKYPDSSLRKDADQALALSSKP